MRCLARFEICVDVEILLIRDEYQRDSLKEETLLKREEFMVIEDLLRGLGDLGDQLVGGRIQHVHPPGRIL